MARDGQSLTGIWHGLYSYSAQPEPVYFVATLIQFASALSGTTHEQEIGETGAPLTLFALIEGSISGSSVVFSKTYDGSGGWDHAVAYDGMLSADRNEIEGEWQIDVRARGRFLMIRSSGASEKVVREAFEPA